MGEVARQPAILQRYPRVDEGRGSAVVIYKERLALGVCFDFPTPWQLQLTICKLVEEDHKVPVMLVALKVSGITTHLQDHVLYTAAAGEHPVRCIVAVQHSKKFWVCDELDSRRLEEMADLLLIDRGGGACLSGVRISFSTAAPLSPLTPSTLFCGHSPLYVLVPSVELLHLMCGP